MNTIDIVFIIFTQYKNLTYSSITLLFASLTVISKMAQASTFLLLMGIQNMFWRISFRKIVSQLCSKVLDLQCKQDVNWTYTGLKSESLSFCLTLLCRVYVSEMRY